MKQAITNLDRAEVVSWLSEKDIPKYRAQQIFSWLYKHDVADWSAMTTLSKNERELLRRHFLLYSLQKKEECSSNAGDAVKYLLEAGDKQCLETVLIKTPKRRTVCLSTQIGCRFRCSFCASGAAGLARNLDTAEILDQVRIVNAASKHAITNIVFMGMGEPLDNYDNTLKAVRRLISPEGFGLGARRITISTVGLISEIERFAQAGLAQVKLSVSLHAAFDEKRKRIMPAAHSCSLQSLIACLIHVRNQFKRDITLEYIVFKDFNDQPEDIKELSRIADKLHAKVNLIGYNRVSGAAHSSVSHEDLEVFKKSLERHGVRVTLRHSAGADITAACGQLRRIS